MFVQTPLQVKLFPCDNKYSENEISALKKSWAQIIKDKVLPFLGTLELEFAKFFHKTMGRPIKYISLLIVVHIFKEMYDWTDEELLENVKFDKRFEYAFELPYAELTVCQKTLHNFRMLLQTHDMARVILDRATRHIVKIFNLDTSKQRLDSTHILSNMAKLSRLALFVRVLENFLIKLKKIDAQAFASLPTRFMERYGKRRGYFADARSKKTKHRLGESANDMYYLIERFSGHEEMSSLKVTEHLQRVFNEHCTTRKIEAEHPITVEVIEEDTIQLQATQADEEHTGQKVDSLPEPTNHLIVKAPQDMPSGTLQNPSDEDVTYGHKGAGYEATVAETCSEENPFQVITDVQTDPSDHSDQNKTMDVVERIDANDMKPDVLYTDGTFTSGENIVECADKGVDLQGNLVGDDKHPEKLKLADFEFAQDGITVTACPKGEKPVTQKQANARKPKSKSQQSFLVHFNLDRCKNCSCVARCPVKLQKKQAVIRFTRAQLASSLRRREQETEAFKEQNKIRAGIESTNAEMKKSQGLGRLRVRGQPRVNQTVLFKALACNIKRMVKYVQSVQISAPNLENEAEIALNPANC
ncbi:MAG: transposase [bacterium]